VGPGARIDEPVVVVEAGGDVQRADMLAPGAPPEVEQRWIAGVDVLPEPFAGAERIDDDVGGAGEALEELREAARERREGEDVDAWGRRACLERQASDGVVQSDDFRAAAARPRFGGPALAEHGAVKVALPSHRLLVSGQIGRGAPAAVGPRRQQIAAGVRVL